MTLAPHDSGEPILPPRSGSPWRIEREYARLRVSCQAETPPDIAAQRGARAATRGMEVAGERIDRALAGARTNVASGFDRYGLGAAAGTD
jgi:hypothetical protein